MYFSGTEEYITRVVEQYSPMLLHLAMTRVNCTADAEDVVQEVFGGDGAILTPAGMEAAVAADGDAQPHATVGSEGEGSFVVTEE